MIEFFLLSTCMLLSPPASTTERKLTDRELIEKADNSSVVWSGQFIGIVPQVEPRVLKACERHEKDVWYYELMLKKLADERSFAFAHAVLTYSPNQHLAGLRLEGWFGFKVELHANGKTVFPRQEEQIKYLQKLWKPRLKHMIRMLQEEAD